MDIVDEIFEDANFEAIMDNDEEALSEAIKWSEWESEWRYTKSKIVYPE